jgi:hypothetical protein
MRVDTALAFTIPVQVLVIKSPDLNSRCLPMQIVEINLDDKS